MRQPPFSEFPTAFFFFFYKVTKDRICFVPLSANVGKLNLGTDRQNLVTKQIVFVKKFRNSSEENKFYNLETDNKTDLDGCNGCF